MRIGLFGFAGAGKTQVFNLLTGLSAELGAGRKDKANLGVTKVPDPRVDYLTGIFSPKKTVYANISFADMPGQAPSKAGGGLSSQVIGDLRTMDVLALVLRAFENPALEAAADPHRDYLAMEAELVLADLQLVENRIDRLARDRSSPREKEALELCLPHLEAEKPLRTLDLRDDQWETLSGFRFLSQKTLMVLINTAEDHPQQAFGELDEQLVAAGTPGLKLCGLMEAEILELDEEDRAGFLEELGVTESGRERFLQEAYAALDLISFLTVGPDEVRAWTITRGMNAQKAAGRVHSDIERGFIRAEVISYADFQACGSEAEAKAQKRYRLEGKEYPVADGDIINYRFNV